MDFGSAMRLVGLGKSVRRRSWTGPELFFVAEGFLRVRLADGKEPEVLVAAEDIAAEDWEEVGRAEAASLPDPKPALGAAADVTH